MDSSNTQKNSVTVNNTTGGTMRKSFGPGGCQAVTDGRKCGETRNLQIIQEFKRMYESKMKQIDDAAGGDCVQAKINLQQEWIKDLTDQNEMLVRVVEELEVEASERVTMLEEKLQNSAKCASEVMESYRDFSINFFGDLQKMEHVQNDLNNLIELLKRVKHGGLWSLEGLHFYTVNIKEFLDEVDGALIQRNIDNEIDCNCNWTGNVTTNCKNEKLLKDKDKKIKELEEKIKKLKEAVEKNEKAQQTSQQYEDLKKSMLDMRDALTAEVAEKHDTILCMRREVHVLEEQCRQAEQQAHFKDDIIRELRKEIKQLKAQKTDEEKDSLMRKIKNLESENEMMKQAIMKAKRDLDKLEDKAEKYLEEKDNFKRKHKESLELIETLQKENNKSKEHLQTLEEEKKNHTGKLQDKMIKELEDYEKKHRECKEKLDGLRAELEKTKQENHTSMAKVKSLSDENRYQAETISTFKEKLRKLGEKPTTITTGVSCKADCKDVGINPCSVMTKDVGISNTPQTKTVGILSDIESQIIPSYMMEQFQPAPIALRTIACETQGCKRKTEQFQPTPITLRTIACETEGCKKKMEQFQPVPTTLRTIACETEGCKRNITKHQPRFETITTVNSYDETRGPNIFTVSKPPILKKKDVIEILEILEPATLDTYGCGPCLKDDPFGFVQTKFTTTGDKRDVQELMNLAFINATRGQHEEVQVFKSPGEARSNTEVLYNCDSMCQSSNDSFQSENADNNILDQGFIEKSSKSVRIDTKPLTVEKTSKDKSTDTGGSESENVSGTYYSMKGDPNVSEAPHTKKEITELETRKKKKNDVGRSESPRRTSSEASSPTENLHNVVQDLNESVSRIIEKSPNEKATRQKIAQLEEQLRLALKQKERDVEVERQKRNQEVENLKMTINEMEKALKNKQMNSNNLQSAVDLYMNSISVLEQSEGRYKNEVTQQRITIANLQETLVTTKQQLDELKQKCQKDLEEKCILLDILDISLNDLEKQCYHYYNQYVNSATTIEYLRDEMLKLEVERFDLTQDVLLMESRLLKYQQVLKQYEGKYLGQECSEYCIKQDESVVTLAQDTISYTEDLQCQLAVIETALKREQKINIVQANRIEELQNIIGAKNLELSRTNDACHDVKSKLDASTSRTKMLEEAIKELQEQLGDVELENIYQEEKVDICHGELDICLNNLQSVKLKLRSRNKAMYQKLQEHAQLQADYRIQVNNVEIFKRDLENTRIRCRDEIIELKHNIRDLKEKLAVFEDKIDSLNKEVKQSQALLVEASHRESIIKQDFMMRETKLTEKIHSAQEEEMRLLDVVTQLEQQTADMKNELQSRDQQLELAKNTILQLNADAIMKQQTSQEEVNNLKNEINTLLQQQGVQKADNERLHQQVECMKCCIHQNESVNKSVKQQLDKCLNDLKNIEADKFFLEQRNVKLMETLDKMHAALQTRTESIATMEVELLEAKTSRDEVCNESRNVVSNVRAWLEEQKQINEELKEKLQKKNALIVKYEQERRKAQCDYNYRAPYQRQRAGSLQPNYFQNNSHAASRSPWSLDSRGSGSDSPASSVSSTPADWYEYEEVGYDAMVEEISPELWIHRVESMTEELQRSNRYWKKKMNDSEFVVTKDK